MADVYDRYAKKYVNRLQQLGKENKALRKTLCDTIAQLCYVEGGSFAEVDRRIAQYGYRLDSHEGLPKIVPIEEGAIVGV